MTNTQIAVDIVEHFGEMANRMQSFTIDNIVPLIKEALDDKDGKMEGSFKESNVREVLEGLD